MSLEQRIQILEEKLKQSAFIEIDGDMFRMVCVIEEDKTAMFTDEDTGEEYVERFAHLLCSEIRFFKLVEIVC